MSGVFISSSDHVGRSRISFWGTNGSKFLSVVSDTQSEGLSPMIEKRERTKNGKVVGHSYRVRWIDQQGKKHSETCSSWREANRRDKEIALARSGGEEWRLTASKTTFGQFMLHEYQPNRWGELARNTQVVHRRQFKRIVNRFGEMQLRAIRPKTVSDFKQEMIRDGVGDPTIRRTLSILQGVLEHAVELEYISVNPARAVRKPAAAKRVIAPPVPGPLLVEGVRAKLLAQNREMDAVLVGVLGYAGLRPMEALALRWNDVLPDGIRVDKALANGVPKEPKTKRGTRKVSLLPSLSADLLDWRSRSSFPGADDLVFYTRGGGAWMDSSYRNWRRRYYQPAAKAVGLNSLRPYDLRHSFASLLIQEQRLSNLEIAYQMGHELTMTETTYAKVIDQFVGQGAIDPDAEIISARKKVNSAGTKPAKLGHQLVGGKKRSPRKRTGNVGRSA